MSARVSGMQMRALTGERGARLEGCTLARPSQALSVHILKGENLLKSRDNSLSRSKNVG